MCDNSHWLLISSSIHLFFNFYILSKLYNFNLKFHRKQDYKIDYLSHIVVLQPNGGWQHNYSTKTKQSSCTIKRSIYSLFSMGWINKTSHDNLNIILQREERQLKEASSRVLNTSAIQHPYPSNDLKKIVRHFANLPPRLKKKPNWEFLFFFFSFATLSKKGESSESSSQETR